MPNATGEKQHCLFCPTDPMRSDVLRKHCQRKHASAVDIATKPNPAMKYVWHLLEGSTDRVWATCRGGESPMSIGYCADCCSFIERDGYKGIEDAVKAHTCREVKARPARGPTVPIKPAGGAGMSGGGYVAPPKKSLLLTQDTVQAMFKSTITGVPGQRALEILDDDDGDIDIQATLDNMLEQITERQKVVNENKRLKAEVEALRAAGASTADDVAFSWDDVIKVARRCPPVRAIVPEILESAKSRKDDDEELGEAFLIALCGWLGEARKRADREAKEAADMDRERAKISTEHIHLQQRLLYSERQVASRDHTIAALEARIAALEKAAAKEE